MKKTILTLMTVLVLITVSACSGGVQDWNGTFYNYLDENHILIITFEQSDSDDYLIGSEIEMWTDNGTSQSRVSIGAELTKKNMAESNRGYRYTLKGDTLTIKYVDDNEVFGTDFSGIYSRGGSIEETFYLDDDDSENYDFEDDDSEDYDWEDYDSEDYDWEDYDSEDDDDNLDYSDVPEDLPSNTPVIMGTFYLDGDSDSDDWLEFYNDSTGIWFVGGAENSFDIETTGNYVLITLINGIEEKIEILDESTLFWATYDDVYMKTHK